MNQEQMLSEIREANLTYLMLAQKLIQLDQATAQYRLGVSAEAADLIATLSPAQIMKISANNMLLFRCRADDDMVWGLLTNHKPSRLDNEGTAKLHACILMSQPAALS